MASVTAQTSRAISPAFFAWKMEECGAVLITASSMLVNDIAITPKARRIAFDLSHGILCAAILIALSFLVVLSNDDIQLRKDKVRLRSQLAASLGGISGPPQAQIGDIVPSFEGASFSGKPTRVSYDKSRYLLFIMSLECDACLNEIPTWNAIAEGISRRNYSVIGVVAGARSVTVPPASFELVPVPDMSVQRAYRIVAVPAVMVVSQGGTVEWIHYGALTEDLHRDLLSVLSK